MDETLPPEFSPSPADQPVTSEPLEEGVFRFKRGHVYAALLPLAFVAGLAMGFLVWGRQGSPTRATAADRVSPSAQGSPSRYEVSVDDDPAFGPEDAPITIVEFSDFNCPYCRKFHQQTFSDLLRTFPDQIRFVYRDFPIVGGGAVGFAAAQAANCAGEQGAYWEYHDALFSGRYSLAPEGYVRYAEELGLDASALTECIAQERYAEEVLADARYASSLGVTGTPTFFINGIPLVGAQPLSSFVQVIEAELGE